MAQFSESEIDAAKRRVWEMQNRASRYTSKSEPANVSPFSFHTQGKAQREETEKSETQKSETDKTQNSSVDSAEKDKSFGIILALILLLSKEGADNTLILALLYLLL